MKKITLAAIAFILVFTLVDFSFAANDFQIKGTVTQINGNQITIKDDKGKETTIECDTSGIKAGDKIILTGTIKLQDRPRELTAEEIDFLVKQCLIDRADVDIIKQLSNRTQAYILKWTVAQDCKKLTPFKSTRNYYRQLKPGVKLPTPPATWDFDYLTDEEYLQYVDILNKAPI